MRPDLNKLLCERERRGGIRTHKVYRRRKPFVPKRAGGEGENLPAREGMALRYGWNGKEFNENLAPLRGQLRKAIGTRWDRFYSDLRKVFDMRSVINQHILQHLEQYIERNVFVGPDGKLWFKSYPDSKPAPLRGSDTEIYVDPRDGIIKRNPQRETRRTRELARRLLAKGKPGRIAIDADTELRLIDGAWFVLRFRDVAPGEWVRVQGHDPQTLEENSYLVYRGPRCVDVLTGAQVHSCDPPRQPHKRWPRMWVGEVGAKARAAKARRYCWSKRSAPKKLLRQYEVTP